MATYAPILVFTLVAVGFLVVTLMVAKLLRHHTTGRTSRDPYECGNEPETLALEYRFSIRYYLIAVLFVVFDVETVFLYPWAVMFDELALFGFIEMTVFLVILIVGYAYVWRRGALKWA
ncbi:MAG: NADH-quinone oxidoreductase subunit A [Thermoanaerobaculia bacterium]|nr:NADH-quinone oxidoreductase subunit A [Thermoanaerobaculia bacterium]